MKVEGVSKSFKEFSCVAANWLKKRNKEVAGSAR